MNLNGKTVLFLGSSVTYGSVANGISFADIMAEECGINCIKEAVSGTTLADINDNSYVSRLKKLIEVYLLTFLYVSFQQMIQKKNIILNFLR